MACVLARAGLSVVVLERQRSYHDRVRGEYLAVWGVAEAQRLGLLYAFLAAGGVFIRRAVPYDETRSPAAAEADARNSCRAVPGPLGVGHPTAEASADRAHNWRAPSLATSPLPSAPSYSRFIRACSRPAACTCRAEPLDAYNLSPHRPRGLVARTRTALPAAPRDRRSSAWPQKHLPPRP